MDAKNISPLLDNMIVGDPISDHHGIQCCPAVNTQNENKYIIKIISVPASQTQLDALLLTGAVANQEAAKEYFEKRVNDHIEEIHILQDLSRQEGFIGYEGYQIVPKEVDTGFDIYILSRYKRTLDRQLTKTNFTHLDALNLGLDICSALNACRRNGYIFVNLKPTNIYRSETGEYKISDFGFVKLSNLKYATIPDHYIGQYAAPELSDAFSFLNDRIDVYALGKILYQIYNGGVLPENGNTPLEPPVYADPELAQIILKACAVQPDERWQDPAQMGQMLVSYMQQFGVQDLPIVPPEPEKTADAETEYAEETVELSDDPVIDDLAEETESSGIASDEEPMVQEETLPEDIPVAEDEPAAESDDMQTEPAEEIEDLFIDSAETINEDMTDEIPVSQEAELTEPSDIPSAEEDDPFQYDGLSDEVTEILFKADSLAAMEVPEPVVAPEAKEILLPEPESNAAEDPDTTEETDENEEEPKMEYYVDIPNEPHKSHWLRNLILILLALGTLVGGYLFYRLYILQTVDKMTLTGTKDQLTVQVQSEIDEKILSVSCTEVYTMANITAPVINGEANFSGLKPGTEYSIELKVNGLHILTGDIKQTYYSTGETKIEELRILTGTVPGSAVLSFIVNGKTSENWLFTYSCPGSKPQTAVFQGTTLTLSDLEEGKVYTGFLEPEDPELYISQDLEITFTPSEIVKANDLMIVSCVDGTLVAQWNAPEAVKVDSWLVRCYNEKDYDKTVTIRTTTAEFTGLNTQDAFTVEVTAAGQSIKQAATVSANSVTVSNIAADTSNPGVIDLTWEASAVPESGWIITYNTSGCESVVRVTGESNTAQLSPAIPGATYSVIIRSADSVQTLCTNFVCTTPDAESFSMTIGNDVVTPESLLYSLCKRPAQAEWTYHDVANNDYTSKFSLSQEAGMVIFLNDNYASVNQEITAAFVVYDSEDQIISIDSQLLNWNSMWIDKHCHLSIPTMPNAVGKYSISLYFNGAFVKAFPFTII